MALVDTQGFVMAVDRSLFGPQGRRWIERKLPNVATNISFVAVSAFGACVLVFHITRDYHNSGYWAILQTPKHILNAVVLHLVVRALRWHIDRMLGVNFAAGDEALPGFFGQSARGGRDGGGGPADDNRKSAVLWPWQSWQNQSRTPHQTKDRSDSADSTTDQEQQGWWRGGGGGGGGDNQGRNPPSNKKSSHHQRSLSADLFPAGGRVSVIQEETASVKAGDRSSEVGSSAGISTSLSLGMSSAAATLPRGRARDPRRRPRGGQARPGGGEGGQE
ncbi:unnamed protein product, partial [Pylaiella littoralis]